MPHRDQFQGYKRSGQMLFNNVNSIDHHNIPTDFDINQTMRSPYTKKTFAVHNYSSTPKNKKTVMFHEKGLTDSKLTEH